MCVKAIARQTCMGHFLRHSVYTPNDIEILFNYL